MTEHPSVAGEVSAGDPRKVFVVHGRDLSIRDAMFDFLRSLDLKPIEWTAAVAMTGKASPYIGEVLDTAFGHAGAVVVLLTPDEVAYLQPRFGSGDGDPETQPAAQARPNVLFEAGMAMGRHPDRTVLVEVGTVRPFSDVAGRHVVRMSNAASARQDLAQRLQSAGCAVDLTGTDWQIKGDFAEPSPPGDGLPLGRRVPSSTRVRRPVEFDLKYLDRGHSRIGRLQVINRGSETAFDVTLSVPDGCALDVRQVPQPIPKIPGGGKSVTVDAMNNDVFLGGPQFMTAFDVKVTGRTDSGETISQDVFIDMNG